MSSPTRRHRSQAFRPQHEPLEGRQLLAKMVSGTDIDGDTWTLRLTGPGDLSVTTQDSSNGTPVPLDEPSLINQITIVGANPNETRLVGTVTKGPNGDGAVYFQNLTEIGVPGAEFSGSNNFLGNGLKSVDMPDFYLGDTLLTGGLTTSNEPAINIPDGIVSLRFGGVNTDAFFGDSVSDSPNQNNQADQYSINLGEPRQVGTSIIVNSITTDAQAGVATSTDTSPSPTQDGVQFTVDGRINLFQANTISGNTTYPSTGLQGGGGTVVVANPVSASTLVGDIGTIRVGGNATNFAVQTANYVGAAGGNIQDYYVGGETNNDQVLATGSLRTASFGLGMDLVTIEAGLIQSLSANRGALNSNVTTVGPVARVKFGGDVTNTNVFSGYNVPLESIFANQTAPTTNPNAEPGGRITASVAGNVTDSVFAASVEPGIDGFFGSPDDLYVPAAHIQAKVQGTISEANSTNVNNSSDTAFFAKNVSLAHGPVTPPDVPEPPFGTGARVSLPRPALGLASNGTSLAARGVEGSQGQSFASQVAQLKATIHTLYGPSRPATTATASVPKGPAATQKAASS